MNADGSGLTRLATIIVREPATARPQFVFPSFSWDWHWVLPWNWPALLRSSHVAPSYSWVIPSDFCWSPNNSKIAFSTVRNSDVVNNTDMQYVYIENLEINNNKIQPTSPGKIRVENVLMKKKI